MHPFLNIKLIFSVIDRNSVYIYYKCGLRLYFSNGTHNIVNDVCLIKTIPMRLDGTTRDNVCLPSQGEHISPDDNMTVNDCYIAGWGDTTFGSVSRLQSARVNIFSADYCQNMTDLNFDPDVEFCAGYMTGGRDSCQGDSGGPLVCVVNQTPILYGVTSWGIGCGEPASPGLYASVASKISWFNTTMNALSMTSTSTSPPITTTPPGRHNLVTRGFCKIFSFRRM